MPHPRHRSAVLVVPLVVLVATLVTSGPAAAVPSAGQAVAPASSATGPVSVSDPTTAGVGVAVGTAVDPGPDASPTADPTDGTPSGVTLCEQEAAGYAPRGGCQLVVVGAVSACVGGAPVLDYAVRPEGTDHTSLSITWLAPDGADIVYSGLPLTGRVLWPGVVIEAGQVVDWPGWTRTADGQWVVGDEYDWVRPEVSLLLQVNPQVQTSVGYPPETAPCADPPAQGVVRAVDVPAGAVDRPAQQSVVVPAGRSARPASTTVLAATGVDVAPVLRVAAGLLVVGVLLVLAGRAMSTPRRRWNG